jgi:RNA 3'-terminal phosphate cyclase (ATP)
MPRLIPIDGAAKGAGKTLRAALSLSAVTGQGFEMTRIRAGHLRPGLRADHLGAIRAVALACNARVGGAFEGSPDLRFEPGPVAAGEFEFDLGAVGPTALVLQVVGVPLATATGPSRLTLSGGTHVPAGPSYHYVAQHWVPLVERLGLVLRPRLVSAGFYPKGGGALTAEIDPWKRPASLHLVERGPLRAVRGVSGAGRLKGGIAEKQRDAAAKLLWEKRRLEVAWEVPELTASSPGSFVLLEAVFEHGRGACGILGERGVAPEVTGEHAARELLRFLDGEGAVDGAAAAQLAVPLALSGGGGVVSTSEITSDLQIVVAALGLFEIQASIDGLHGAAGRLEVGAH